MMTASRQDLIRDLRERTQRIAAAARAPRPELSRPAVEPAALEQAFAGGDLVEWLSASAGCGAVTLALSVAAKILQGGGMFVLIDREREFYPPALAQLGIPLERTAVVRPDTPLDALWAWEQSLRCPAVAVTLGRIAELTDRHDYRLRLAAETGGGLGFLLRSAAFRNAPSRAAVRLRVSARPSLGPPHPPNRRLSVEFLQARGGAAGTILELELGYETDHVHRVSELADPAPTPRPAAIGESLFV